ncbi:MAG: hypothetical protein ACLFUB_13055 [Cyclobacteriaceae bacterium]
MKAIEVKGRVDDQGKLLLDQDLFLRNEEVRVIILSEEDEEKQWLRNISSNPTFDFLKNEEDIYTIEDGKPFDE